MADKKISDLTAATSLADGDLFEIENAGGNSRQVAMSVLRAAMGFARIDEQSPSGTGTVTFNSIVSDYRDLVVVIRGRGTAAATAVNVLVRLNNDSGANYDAQRLQGNNATANSNATVGNTDLFAGTYLAIPASTATADVAGSLHVEIYDYKGTTFQKSAHALNDHKTSAAAANLLTVTASGWWRNTAAVTRVDVILSSGNFVSGSVVSLYGRM